MSARILGESLAQLRETRHSIKWTYYDPDVLPMWVAEMDARPCRPVVDAVTRAMETGDTGYDDSAPYAEALGRFASRRWGWELDPGLAFPVGDVMVGVAALLRLVTDPGGPVVVNPPVYNAFYGFLDHLGRRPVAAPVGPDGRIDLEALERAFASVRGERAAYLLCNPHNPTGNVPTREELTTVAELARRHGVQVISDEIHGPLVHPGVSFTPYLTVDTAGITVISAAKAWNAAALKAALVVPGEEARNITGQLHEVLTHAVSHLGAVGQTAAFDHGEPWLDQVLSEIGENFMLLEKLFAEQLPQVRFRRPDSTYFAWLDCRELPGEAGRDPARVFRERGRVALTSGEEYAAVPGFARLNIATSPEVLTEGVRRMAAACDL